MQRSRCSGRINFFLYIIMNCAKNKINRIFAASEGWKVIPNKEIQRCAPPPEDPETNTSTSSMIQAAYMTQ